MGKTRHQNIPAGSFSIFTLFSPVLLQFRALPASMCISRLCCKQSPRAIRQPPPKVLVTIRKRPWNNSRHGKSILLISILLAWGIMSSGKQSVLVLFASGQKRNSDANLEIFFSLNFHSPMTSSYPLTVRKKLVL